ncbi:MAG: hypothetical protein NVS3B14_11590 [Ktedonobacteraceae bacterium]
MRTSLRIPEGLLSRINRADTRSKLSRGPLAWCIIVLVMALFLIPYTFSNTITKALGAYATLPTLSIADAVLSMLPVAVAVLFRARTGAMVICLLIALSTALYNVVVSGLAWPPGTVMGWLLATSGLTVYGLIAGNMRAISNQLAQAHATIQKQALTDALTGLPNHRAIIEHMENELARAQRFERPFSLIFFDGDRFKQVNDTYGHGIGDVVLRELGERVESVLRGGDTLGRFGGEEFVILLPEADLEQACLIAERIRAAVAATPLATKQVEEGINATISVGVATYPTDGETISSLLEKADQAMYWAKRLGRNQVRTAVEARRTYQHATFTALLSVDGRESEATASQPEHEQTQRAYYLGSIFSLLRMIELRDPAIGKHAYAVSDLATALALQMQLEQKQVVAIGTAALLHDIGKIGMPDAILQKRGPLSYSERAIIKQHPAVGAQLLETSPCLQELMPAIRHHHERWDGKGYPDGLAGQNIPLEARIIAVAEAYAAMVTGHPYQASRPPADALAELQRYAGTQFDPDVVRAAALVLANSVIVYA